MKMMNFNSSPLESNLVNKVKDYIRTTYRRDAWFFKVAGSATQRSGIPDILCCIKGKFIALELKREDGSGRPSPQQIIECEKIKDAGGYPLISGNFDEIKNFISGIVNDTKE